MINEKEAYDRVWCHYNAMTPFSREDFDMVVSCSRYSVIRKNEFVFKQGSIPTFGGYVFKGCLRQFIADKNTREETVVGFNFEDSCFGDIRGIFYNEPSHTSLQAMEDTIIGRLDKEHYLSLFDNCKSFARLMMVAQERRNSELVQECFETKNVEAEVRYLKMLTTYPHILLRASQRDIASYLGIKPQSLSRIRKNISQTSIDCAA
ncbi:Crp/Fnr family transcriptional regulator [Chryseolinea sp. T2]|uniref:Crp/Fnr family transcriptional regulator n=1 Tax=Chryseolinea sp. T2 TaxID=3129255 RepID=UPI003077E56B